MQFGKIKQLWTGLHWQCNLPMRDFTNRVIFIQFIVVLCQADGFPQRIRKILQDDETLPEAQLTFTFISYKFGQKEAPLHCMYTNLATCK